MRRLRRQDAQASAELVAMTTFLIAVALVLAQLVLAGWTLLTAGEAARAGARAAHLGADPAAATDRAVPSVLERPRVTEEQGQVRVRLQAPGLIPGLPRISVEAAAVLDPSGGGA